MTHCRICGVLEDVGEIVICEDCADKMETPINSFTMDELLSEICRRSPKMSTIALMELLSKRKEVMTYRIEKGDQKTCYGKSTILEVKYD